MSSTRKILDVSHSSFLSCCSVPALIEMNLNDGPTYVPGRKIEATLNIISGSFNQLQAIKMAILVKIEVRDLNKKIIEVSETEVLSSAKLDPFGKKGTRKETLVIDFEHYKEIVETAKNEFKLLQRLDFTAGLLKNENPIMTSNVKRANRERDESSVAIARNSPWGRALKH